MSMDNDSRGVGFVGLGRMGSSMARQLLAAGLRLTVYDVNPDAVAVLAGSGANAADTPAAVARQSSCVVVMVVDDQQTREVVSGADGLLAGASAGTIVVLSSSLLPSTVRQLGDLCKPRGVHILDAPVTGGEQGAAAGTLTFLVGGDPEPFRRAVPVLEPMAERVVRVGSLGSGQVAKVAHNALLWSEVAVVGEVLQLARREGVSLDDLRTALRGTPGDNRPLQRWEDFGWAPWAVKDLQAALASGQGVNVPMPLTELIQSLFQNGAVQLPPSRA